MGVAGLETYLVGGAVRDALMGLPVQDRDWVVVGATPQQLLDQGFTQVGRDFPVFLHPYTHEEYALARTERSTGPGYRGFAVHASPGVTLEEDLARRDLTINAMAVRAGNGLPGQALQAHDLVDPFHGLRDLRDKVLRHVTPAFREDPVRILRLARFAARFGDYAVAPETMALMRSMVEAGDVDHLVAERVWQELSRGLMEQRPDRMFAVLRECGALAHLLPELEGLWTHAIQASTPSAQNAGERSLQALQQAVQGQAPLAVRFACLVHALGQHLESTEPAGPAAPVDSVSAGLALLGAMAQRLRVPSECGDLGALMLREQDAIGRSTALDAAGVLALMERCDALRKPDRFADLLLATGYVDATHDGSGNPGAGRSRLAQALTIVRGLRTDTLAREAMAQGARGETIGEAIRQARIRALQETMP